MLIEKAIKHIGDIVHIAINHQPEEKALVVYDTQNGLTRILLEAYKKVLPDATFVDFDAVSKEEVVQAFNNMKPNDLVVLLQSSNFLLDAFRIRLHLFNQKLKVIEHMHLYRNIEEVWDVYIDSLAYDPSWYRVMGPALKQRLDRAKSLRLISGDTELTVGALEEAKLNIGDYTGMENIGGTFPIGEVFTEAKDFNTMNGSLYIYAYAKESFSIEMQTPFRIDIKNGLIVGWQHDAPESFPHIIETVTSYERPLVREIGFGLNRAITRERYLNDITAFERILGLHISLGEKHSVYKKEGITTHKTKFHIDLFPVIDRVYADDEVIFDQGRYLVI